MASNNIGIEIGNRSVSMTQIRNGKYIMACERLPENVVRDGTITAPEVLSGFLRDMKRKYKFSGKKCSVVLPQNATFFRSVTMPLLTEQQLELNLPYEFRDFVGDNAVGYNYDYALMHMNEDEEGKPMSMDIVAGAALKRTVNDYAAILKRARLKMNAAVPREMTIINLLRNAQEKGLCSDGDFCIAEISDDTTFVSIISDMELSSSKNIDIACRQIDEAIADSLITDTYLAATYRETNHDSVQELPECRAVYESIALEILKAVNFYRYENQQSEISRILFCGPGSRISALTGEILNLTGLTEMEPSELLEINEEDRKDAELCMTALGALG